jgi:hypothetical protein
LTAGGVACDDAAMKLTLALALTLAACGGGAAQPAPAEPTPVDEKPAEDHHGDLPDAVHAFHDALRPLWHSEAGPERTEKVCAAVPDLQAEAGPMSDGSPVPEDRLADYSSKVGELKSALVALEEACAEDGRPEFQAAFTKVHDAFHAIAEFFEK